MEPWNAACITQKKKKKTRIVFPYKSSSGSRLFSVFTLAKRNTTVWNVMLYEASSPGCDWKHTESWSSGVKPPTVHVARFQKHLYTSPTVLCEAHQVIGTRWSVCHFKSAGEGEEMRSWRKLTPDESFYLPNSAACREAAQDTLYHGCF